MSWRWGHKREISGHLRAQKLQEAHAIFVKIKKLRSPTETEMAFMGILKVSSIKSFSGNCGSKVLEKFQVFSDTTPDYAGFPRPRAQLPAWSRRQLADNTFA
jgi:hypothetical protein